MIKNHNQIRRLTVGAPRPMELPPLKSDPLVSVIMTNHNYAAYIALAIESVLLQTYQNFELVICDDGSSDRSREIIGSYAEHDTRIHLVCHSRSRGFGAGIGTAYSKSSGELICFLDADDTLAQNRLETLVRYFRNHPRVGVVCHELTMVDVSGERVSALPFRTKLESGWIGEEVIRRGGRWSSMPGGGVCLRREVADSIFPLPVKELTSYADSFITLLAPLLTEVGTIPEELYNYRIHDRNLMQRSKRDESITTNILQGTEMTTRLANERLEEWGYSGVRIDVTKNLSYRQHLFLHSAFAGEKRVVLVRECCRLVPLLLFDDLYRFRDRAARLAIYASAIPLPLNLRRWWLSASRTPEYYLWRIRHMGRWFTRRAYR